MEIGLNPIRRDYKSNADFRQRLGQEKVGVMVIVNFDNDFRTDIEERRRREVHSNTVHLDQAALR